MEGGGNMEFDYRKLLGKIKEVFGKQSAFAVAMDMSERSLSLKLTNQRYFKMPEIMAAINLLGLRTDDIPDYFFTVKV